MEMDPITIGIHRPLCKDFIWILNLDAERICDAKEIF